MQSDIIFILRLTLLNTI